MDIEILFKDASAPKRIEGARNGFTKGDFYCIRVGEMSMEITWEAGSR